MPTFNVGELAWFKSFVQAQALLFEKLSEAGEASLREVDQEWEDAAAANDQNRLEHLADISAEARDYIDGASELALVATYHWVERTTKHILKRLLRSRSKGSGAVSHMDINALTNAFVEEGVDFSGLSNHAEVKLLRLFTNSWKHQVGEEAQPTLCAELGLPSNPAPQGHLAVSEVRKAMAARFGLGAEVQSGAIVRAAVPKALAFLQALAEACP